MNQDRHKRKMSAIFSADVVGYSRLMEEDQAWTIKNIEENKSLISNLIEDYHGRVVDAPGDNILAEFSSVTNAVECAVKIQQELKKKNANIVENRRMEFRIGINLGEIVEEGGRIYGSGVNIAARIEGLSKSGGLCISGRTYDHIKTKFDFGYEYLGEHNVKNISEPIRVYRVLMEPEAAGKIIGDKKPISKPSHKIVIAAIITLIIIVAGLFFWNFYSRDSIKEEAPKTIAVLPFDDLSPEKDQEYFVDGLSEEILNSLAQIPNLHVIAKTSSFSFKGKDKTIQDIAGVLGVDHILEGSVRKDGNALRITAQLIKTIDGSHLWSETYDRELKDIFKIQEDIANSVADKLKLTLEAFKIIGGTDNVAAYDLYLKAKGMGPSTADVVIGFKGALELLDEAIALNSKFALAWSYKALFHNLLSTFGPSNESLAEVNECIKAAKRAIELEPNLGDGYIYLALAQQSIGKWIDAEKNMQKAEELIGELLSGDHSSIAIFYIVVGKFRKAIELLDKMQRNDPISYAFDVWYYDIYGFLGDRKSAEDKYKLRNRNMPKGYAANRDSAITAVRLCSGDAISPDDIVSSDPISIELKKYLTSPKQGLEKLHQIYTNDENLTNTNFSMLGVWATYFGDFDLSMEIIENTGNIYQSWYPIMHEIRKTARFKKFVREIGIFDYWKKMGWPDFCHPVGDDDFECD